MRRWMASHARIRVLHSEQIAQAQQGNRRALSKLITAIEDDLPGAREIIRAIYHDELEAVVIGITGVPGAGKSTFTSQLVSVFRNRHKRVGVLAHDPSSSFTGGAILGDRIRMGAFENDAEVYIRSIASRGKTGGVASFTRDAIQLLNTAGYQVIIVETVGAGQLDIDVRKIADVNIVIMIPGTGDIIQASKAGIIEIGDIFIINKSDLPGADLALQELKSALQLGDHTTREARSGTSWRVPVFKTSSISGEGFEAVADSIDAFLSHANETNLFQQRRKKQHKWDVIDKLNALFLKDITEHVIKRHEQMIADGTLTGDLDPYSAADHLFALITEELAQQNMIGRAVER
jgi:LAO/AO transport system kinase